MQTFVTSQGFEYGVKHFSSPKSGELSDIIAKTLMLPHEQINFLIELGSVYLKSKRAELNSPVLEGDHIRVHTKPRRYSTDFNWIERVVFNHDDFIILNKPGGIPSHPSVDNQIENSLTQLSLHVKEKLFITHRLDTLTEGLIVYAKKSEFAQGFNKQLEKKLITKKYIALVETTQKLPAHLIHYMEPSPRAPKKVSTVFHENWDICELKIEQQKIMNHYSWIKINLLTGRTHQIRSQLSDSNAPIIGDELYGSQLKKQNRAIALRAQEIQFNWKNQTFSYDLDENFEFELK